jgi:hypothetical protein
LIIPVTFIRMKRSRWAFFLLAATAVLFGQRADASRTPLTDIRAAITQPQQLTAPAADAATPADAWLVESITPLGHTDDGQPIVLISLLIPTAHLAEHTPVSTRAGPYAAPKTHTRVFYIGQPPLGLEIRAYLNVDRAIPVEVRSANYSAISAHIEKDKFDKGSVADLLNRALSPEWDTVTVLADGFGSTGAERIIEIAAMTASAGSVELWFTDDDDNRLLLGVITFDTERDRARYKAKLDRVGQYISLTKIAFMWSAEGVSSSVSKISATGKSSDVAKQLRRSRRTRNMRVPDAATSGGVLDNANFAQRTFSETFSSSGKFAGQTIDDVATSLRSGTLKPGDVPIEYIVRDGKTLMLNTRSAQALERAGISRVQWNAVDMTGNAAAEARLAAQLQRNNLTGQGIATATSGRR